MLGRRLRRARRTRTSRPCRTGGRGRCRGCRGRRRRPRGGSRSRSRSSAAAARAASRISSACSAGQRHLRGAGEEELVLGDLVDLVAVAGQEAGPLQRLFADQHRRHHRLVALGPDQLDREADQGQLQQHQVALQVGEARAGERAPPASMSIRPSSVPISRWSRGSKSNSGGSPTSRSDDRVLLGHPVGGVGVGQVGERGDEPVELGLDLLQLLLAGLDPLLQALHRRHQLLGVARRACLASPICLESGLALGLGALDLGQQLAAAGVEGEQLVDLRRRRRGAPAPP